MILAGPTIAAFNAARHTYRARSTGRRARGGMESTATDAASEHRLEPAAVPAVASPCRGPAQLRDAKPCCHTQAYVFLLLTSRAAASMPRYVSICATRPLIRRMVCNRVVMEVSAAFGFGTGLPCHCQVACGADPLDDSRRRGALLRLGAQQVLLDFSD